MTTVLQLLENIGQNTSLKEFDSICQLLEPQKISEEEINELISSNTPLVCAWVPEEDDDDKEDKEKEGEEEETDKKLN